MGTYPPLVIVDKPTPITVTDKAETFAESGTTVTHTNTQTTSEGVEMTEDRQTVDMPAFSGENADSTRGLVISPKADFAALGLYLNNAGYALPDTLEIDDINGTNVYSQPVDSWGWQYIDESNLPTLSVGTEYRVYVTGSNHGTKTGSASSYPYENSQLAVNAAWRNGTRTTSNHYTFGQVQAINDPVTGYVTVSFPAAADLYNWDVLVSQLTESEKTSIEVDVQENSGSGWQTVKTDTPRTVSLSDIAPSSDIRAKVRFGREEVGKPRTARLEYLARRYIQ